MVLETPFVLQLAVVDVVEQGAPGYAELGRPDDARPLGEHILLLPAPVYSAEQSGYGLGRLLPPRQPRPDLRKL